MSKIEYIVDNIINQTPDQELIAIPHVCNNEGRMGAGVARALYEKWPEVKEQYLWHFEMREGVVELGEIIPVRLSDKLVVYNMIAQRGIRATKDKSGRSVGIDGRPPLRYVSLMNAMQKVIVSLREYFKMPSIICCPKFGCDLAGGNWDAIEAMIQEIWCPFIDVKVYVLNESDIPKR